MHESNAVLLELLLIFASAKLLAEIFERLRLPGVLDELAAGIVLGPFALAWIRPGHITEALAELGAIFLLFHVGL